MTDSVISSVRFVHIFQFFLFFVCFPPVFVYFRPRNDGTRFTIKGMVRRGKKREEKRNQLLDRLRSWHDGGAPQRHASRRASPQRAAPLRRSSRRGSAVVLCLLAFYSFPSTLPSFSDRISFRFVAVSPIRSTRAPRYHRQTKRKLRRLTTRFYFIQKYQSRASSYYR